MVLHGRHLRLRGAHSNAIPPGVSRSLEASCAGRPLIEGTSNAGFPKRTVGEINSRSYDQGYHRSLGSLQAPSIDNSPWNNLHGVGFPEWWTSCAVDSLFKLGWRKANGDDWIQLCRVAPVPNFEVAHNQITQDSCSICRHPTK